MISFAPFGEEILWNERRVDSHTYLPNLSGTSDEVPGSSFMGDYEAPANQKQEKLPGIRNSGELFPHTCMGILPAYRIIAGGRELVSQ